MRPHHITRIYHTQRSNRLYSSTSQSNRKKSYCSVSIVWPVHQLSWLVGKEQAAKSAAIRHTLFGCPAALTGTTSPATSLATVIYFTPCHQYMHLTSHNNKRAVRSILQTDQTSRLPTALIFQPVACCWRNVCSILGNR